MADGALPARSGRAIAFVLAAATCWGTIGTAFASILDRVATDGLTVVTLLAATAMLLLWSWLVAAGRGALRVSANDLPDLASSG